MSGKKLYCYVDETGQDTKGALFIVSAVVVVDEDQDIALRLCETIEKSSGKGLRKWAKSRPEQANSKLSWKVLFERGKRNGCLIDVT